VGFVFASRASKGARSYQEDAIALHAEQADGTVAHGPDGTAQGLTAVLADGMGGHVGGARASEVACGHFLGAFIESKGEVPPRLQDALEIANTAIQTEADANPALHGMGCTLIGASFSEHGIEWVSVGDSPLFLIRKSEIVVLNEDHSLAPEIDRLAATGKISWEDAQADPRRHFLRSALTGSDIELIDRSVRPLPLQTDDIVILASDGIHTLSLEDIHTITLEHIDKGPGRVAETLLKTVAERKQAFQDNTTLVIVVRQ
jgi:protein phosphatase